jgi:hypothetical protein
VRRHPAPVRGPCGSQVKPVPRGSTLQGPPNVGRGSACHEVISKRQTVPTVWVARSLNPIPPEGLNQV